MIWLPKVLNVYRINFLFLSNDFYRTLLYTPYIAYIAEHAPPQPSSSTSFPFKELSKQGVNIKEIVIDTDMLIPTNQSTTPIEGTCAFQMTLLLVVINPHS